MMLNDEAGGATRTGMDMTGLSATDSCLAAFTAPCAGRSTCTGAATAIALTHITNTWLPSLNSLPA